MKKPTGTTDPNLSTLLIELRKASIKHSTPIWNTIAKYLKRSRRHRVVTNVSRLNRFTQKEDLIVIPGKLLGAGEIDHPLTVSAWTFSDTAQKKITGVGGQCLSLSDLMKKYPKGQNIRIMA